VVGFSAAERANRILAANAGKGYAERMYKIQARCPTDNSAWKLPTSSAW
jgi:hypothetical protein